MIDLTEKFFNEIITSRKYTIRSFKDNPLETKKFSGKCAVVSKRGKEKARDCLILININTKVTL